MKAETRPNEFLLELIDILARPIQDGGEGMADNQDSPLMRLREKIAPCEHDLLNQSGTCGSCGEDWATRVAREILDNFQRHDLKWAADRIRSEYKGACRK